jgi:hypothetical protein
MERPNPLYYNLPSKKDIDIIETKAKKIPLSKTYNQTRVVVAVGKLNSLCTFFLDNRVA